MFGGLVVLLVAPLHCLQLHSFAMVPLHGNLSCFAHLLWHIIFLHELHSYIIPSSLSHSSHALSPLARELACCAGLGLLFCRAYIFSFACIGLYVFFSWARCCSRSFSSYDVLSLLVSRFCGSRAPLVYPIGLEFM